MHSKPIGKRPSTGAALYVAPHFNLTVEIPLKAVVRGYTWKSLPITWRNRRTGDTKLKIKEMGSGYLLTCWHIWLEKYVSRRDHQCPIENERGRLS